MGYWLGIDVGSTVTVAAVCRQRGPAEVVALGADSVGVPSVVSASAAGEVAVGLAAPDRVVRGFVDRVGDQVPMVCGGQAYPAAQLVAMVVRWVVERVASRLDGPAQGIVVTHPVGWGEYKCRVLAGALAAAGVVGVRLCAQPAAAVASGAAGAVGSAATVAVVDVGGSSCQATVVRTREAGECAVVGAPQVLAQLGGADFDDAVFGHLLAAVPALACLDGEDPATLAATVALRRACTRAKEALSADTEVSIPVRAPGIDTAVRLHRGEFEDLIRSQLADAVELVRRALRSAQLEPAEVDAVLLVGGSARIPLLAQLVSTELGHPVTIDTDPASTLARGAATLARGTTPPAPYQPEPDDRPEPKDRPQSPQRPALTALPFQAVPIQRRSGMSQKVKRAALAGSLALLAAAASAPFLISRGDPVPQAAAGSPAPPTPGTPASTETNQAFDTGNGTAAMPVAAPHLPASTTPGAQVNRPQVAEVHPASASTTVPVANAAGTASPPPGASATTPVSGSAATPPVSDGGQTTKPAGDGSTPGPASGGGATTSSSGGTSPVSGSGGTAPASGGETTPASGGGTTPASEGGTTGPASGSGGTAPASGGGATSSTPPKPAGQTT
jgi:actin-like ATPase involved in cell morphogenesis